MGSAVIGLIGVVIGGLLSSGTSYYLDRRKSRADLRAALRNVLTDLHNNRGLAAVTVQLWNQPGGASDDSVLAIVSELKRVTSESWQSNRKVLAHELSSNDDWDKLSRAFLAADVVRTIGEQVTERNTLTATGMTEVDARLGDLHEGLTVTQRLMGLPQEPPLPSIFDA